MTAQAGDLRRAVWDLALVACSKAKLAHAAPARDLYQGQLFRAARRWAERHADRWYVLSARHHVLDPAQTIEPYDLSLRDLPRWRYQHPSPESLWATRCRALLMADGEHGEARVRAGDRVVMLAGAAYCVVGGWLEAWGVAVEYPLRGLGIGRQKAWLAREVEGVSA